MAGWVEKRGKNTWRLNAPGGTGPDGKRKTYRKVVEATSERQAGKLLAEFVAEIQKGFYIEPSKLTLTEFVERWLKEYGEPNLAPKTLYRYKEVLGRILQAMGHLKLEEIKPLHMVEFYRNLREEGHRADGKPGRLSESTILYHHRVLSKILNDAVKWGLIPFNPTSKVDPPKAKRKQTPCYNEVQTAAMLAALEQEPLQYKTMVILALATGLRRGELMGLEWQDVAFDKGIIEVSRASQYLPKKGIFTKDPKNESSNRSIAVSASVMALLEQYKAYQMEERLKVGDLWQESNRLFTTWDGKPMHPDTISSWFPEFLKRHNLDRIEFKALRHTSATLLISKGIPLKNVSTRLGHSNISTTANIYAHALRSVDQDAAEKLDLILTGEKPRRVE